VLWFLAAWLAASLAIYRVTVRHFDLVLLHPMRGRADFLVYLTPYEPFFALVKLALAAGFLLALPFFLYQAWAFLESGLKPAERRPLLAFMAGFLLLFLSGAAFSYFLVLPASLRFLLGVAPAGLRPYLSFNSYLTFLIIFVLGFGLIFTLPGFIVLLARFGVVSAAQLSAGRKFFWVAAFLLAAVITPTPDAFTQVLMALPLLLLYEIALFFVRLFRPAQQ